MEGAPAGREDSRVDLLRVGLAFLVFAGLLLPLFREAYGIFIDELYFLACSRRPAFGYVDHPPLSILFLTAWTTWFGDSLLSLRVPPALAAAALVLLTGKLAHRLGAGSRGRLLAALSVATVASLNVVFSYYSMNAFEALLWPLLLYLTIELIRSRNLRFWLLIGLVGGVAFLNKHTAVLLFGALGLALAVSRERTMLRSRYAVLAALLALAVVLPNLVWMGRHDWISLEFYRGAGAKNIATPPLAALGQQILALNPGLLPLLVVGLIHLFRSPSTAPYRWIGSTYLILLGAMVFSGQSRPDRIMGIYPVLLAAGAAGVDSYASRSGRWALWAFGMVPLAVYLTVLPVLQPIFPPSFTASYSQRLGFVPAIEKSGRSTVLPQWIADRLGWRELAAAVSRVYVDLPEPERRGTVAVTPGYANAGAIEYYADQMPLPPAFSPHNNYYLWGPPPEGTHTILAVGFTLEELEESFQEVEQRAVVECPLCRSFRQKTWIVLARHPRQPIGELWARSRLLR